MNNNNISILMEEKKGLGSRIRELRSRKKMTQKEFGDLVGSTQSSISGYELEDVPVPADILRNIAEKCGVSADWLLFGTQPEVPKDNKEKQLLLNFREIEKYHGEDAFLRFAKWQAADIRDKYNEEEGSPTCKGKKVRDKTG